MVVIALHHLDAGTRQYGGLGSVALAAPPPPATRRARGAPHRGRIGPAQNGPISILSDDWEDSAVSVVTDQEIACLHSQRLGRLATVGADGQPHVVPVRFRYNADTDSIDIGGFASRKKRRDVEHSGRASIVVDDVPPPWNPRGIEIRGAAHALPEGGKTIQPSFDPELIRITRDASSAGGSRAIPTLAVALLKPQRRRTLREACCSARST
jgi:pyridoxamine 5'-phosphate oxidase family protein